MTPYEVYNRAFTEGLSGRGDICLIRQMWQRGKVEEICRSLIEYGRAFPADSDYVASANAAQRIMGIMQAAAGQGEDADDTKSSKVVHDDLADSPHSPTIRPRCDEDE